MVQYVLSEEILHITKYFSEDISKVFIFVIKYIHLKTNARKNYLKCKTRLFFGNTTSNIYMNINCKMYFLVA